MKQIKAAMQNGNKSVYWYYSDFLVAPFLSKQKAKNMETKKSDEKFSSHYLHTQFPRKDNYLTFPFCSFLLSSHLLRFFFFFFGFSNAVFTVLKKGEKKKNTKPTIVIINPKLLNCPLIFTIHSS